MHVNNNNFVLNQNKPWFFFSFKKRKNIFSQVLNSIFIKQTLLFIFLKYLCFCVEMPRAAAGLCLRPLTYSKRIYWMEFPVLLYCTTHSDAQWSKRLCTGKHPYLFWLLRAPADGDVSSPLPKRHLQTCRRQENPSAVADWNANSLELIRICAVYMIRFGLADLFKHYLSFQSINATTSVIWLMKVRDAVRGFILYFFWYSPASLYRNQMTGHLFLLLYCLTRVTDVDTSTRSDTLAPDLYCT